MTNPREPDQSGAQPDPFTPVDYPAYDQPSGFGSPGSPTPPGYGEHSALPGGYPPPPTPYQSSAPGGYQPPSGGYQAPAPGYPAPGYPAPGYPAAGYQDPYDPYRPGVPMGTNGMAIGALVTSLAGFACGLPAIVGLILGIIAMRQTKQTGQDGYGMALAAVIVGGLITAGMIIYLVIMIVLVAAAGSGATYG